MQEKLSADNWEARWRRADTPWDLKGVTPALVAWAKDRSLKGQDILVPGCGSGHDAHFLSKQGARVEGVDYAAEALASARRQHPNSRVKWRQHDVTALPYEFCFDRVWEYTCFCALNPPLRAQYLVAVKQALKVGGAYWGMVFSSWPRADDGPPFPIDADEFHALLSPLFRIRRFERQTRRSVKQRRGREIWFEVQNIETAD